MEMKVYSKLPSDLARRVKQFGLENFYTEEERTPEHLAEERDKFFSEPEAWLLVFEEDKLTGRLLLHKRKIAFTNKEVTLGGIGGVCIRRDRRRQGVATKMLKKTVGILKSLVHKQAIKPNSTECAWTISGWILFKTHGM